MAEPAADGQPRIDAAKSALNRVVGSLPQDLQVGMRVYGASVFDRKQPGACTDSRLVVPIGTANRPQLQSEIGRYRPFGETPIAYSLEQAGNDLTTTATDGKRQIVLVSDGEETCVPDPCPVAEKLAAKGIDLTINVVGLNVTGKARKDLQCIASKGKGKYFDASDADSLADSLDQAAKRSSVPFQPSGEPIVGTPRSTGAPTMKPGTVQTPGRYTDSFAPDAASRNYLIPRTRPDSTVWLSGMSVGNRSSGHAVKVELTGTDGTKCSKDYSGFFTNTGRVMSNGAVSHGRPESGSTATQAKDGCLGDLVATVSTRDAELAGQAVEWTAIEEPPIINPDELPPAVERPEWTPLAEQPPRPVTPSSTTVNAPLVEPGAYTFDVVSEEVRFVSVDLDWGQHLALRMSATPRNSESEIFTSVFAIPPVGGQSATDIEHSIVAAASVHKPGEIAEAVTPSTIWNNRKETKNQQKVASVAGRHLVAVYPWSSGDGQQEVPTDVTVQLEVVGDPSGAPQQAALHTPDPTTAAPRPDEEAEAQSEPGSGGSADGGTSAVLPYAVGIGGGLVALAGLGTAGILLARRGRA